MVFSLTGEEIVKPLQDTMRGLFEGAYFEALVLLLGSGWNHRQSSHVQNGSDYQHQSNYYWDSISDRNVIIDVQVETA